MFILKLSLAVLLLISLSVHASSKTDNAEVSWRNHIYDVADKISDLEYFHLPRALRYSDQGCSNNEKYLNKKDNKLCGNIVFITHDGSVEKNNYGKISILDRSNLQLIRSIEVKASNRESRFRKKIEKIESDITGNLYAIDTKNNLYKSTNGGVSWLQLDFDNRRNTYSFKSIEELEKNTLRRGGKYSVHAMYATDLGDLIIYTSYDGPRITIIKNGVSETKIGKKLKDNRNTSSMRLAVTYDGQIFFYDEGEMQVVSVDNGNTFNELKIPKDHYLVGVSGDREQLTKHKNKQAYFLDGKRLESFDGKKLYDDFSITRTGVVHNFNDLSNLNRLKYLSADGKVVKTKEKYRDHEQFNKSNTLVVVK